ncbi:MAG: hypothetical protein ACREGD_00300 [Candidatus Saccharimonadales bacterium]
MTNEVILAIIPSLSLGGLVVALFNHFAGVQKEIEQHKRERKEDQYEKLLENLPGFFTGTENKEKKLRFMEELNSNALLFASSKVIRLGSEYIGSFANKKITSSARDEMANKLVIAIRDEIGVDNKDSLGVNDIRRYKLDD